MEYRIDWIDTTKGIGIVLVCLGHCIGLMEMPLNRVILSFHMPLFFYVSGLTLKPFVVGKMRTVFFIKHKFLTLIVPLLSTGIWNSFVHIIFDYMLDKKSIDEFDLSRYFYNWFLLSLFISIIICTMVISIGNIYGILLWLLIICVFLCVENFCFAIIEQSIVAMIFILGGYYTKDSISRLFRGGISGIEIVLIPLLGILSYLNTPVGMADNIYGNKLLFLLNSVLGIIIVVNISQVAQKSKIIRDYCGKNSMIIYATQFASIYLIRRFLQKYFSVFVFEAFPTFFIVFLLLILMEVPIVYILRKYTPGLWGIRK